MSKKIYWGLRILIVIFIAGGVFVLVKQQRELAELRQGVVKADKLLEDHQKQQTVADNKPPRPARDGFEWEWHGDHWHEMPVVQSDVPQQTPASEKIVFTPARKLNFPDKIPEKLPTEAELRQMDGEELVHLIKLYTKASNELRKTDRDAGVRLYNATIPIISDVAVEKADRAEAIIKEQTREHRKKFPVPRSYPATEESPAVHIDTKPPKKVSNEGGKQ